MPPEFPAASLFLFSGKDLRRILSQKKMSDV
jgi:hypothetical protein